MVKNNKVKFSVLEKNYFKHIVLGSKMTIKECSAEETHNIFDNDGEKITIKCFDKDNNLICEDGKTKYLVMIDDCPDSLKNPKGIMESLREKTEEQMNNGVGNFNFGEIGSVFNLGKGCIYLRSKINNKEDVGNKFIIKIGEEDIPVLITELTKEEEEICKNLNIDVPENGTIKIFDINSDIVFNPLDFTKNIADMTNMEVFYNTTRIHGYNYIKDSVIVNSSYKFTEELYGNYDAETKNIKWYSCDKNSSHFSPLKSKKIWPRTDFSKEDFLEDSVQMDNNKFDLKVKGYFTIWPSHDKDKFNSTPGLIFNQINISGKSVNLYNQEKTKKFMNWCLNNDKSNWSYQSPGKDSEYIFEMTILNKKYKSEIFTNLGYFAIKSRNGSFYDTPQRIPFRFIINTLFERYKEKFKKNTGKKSVPTAGISSDSHGNWWHTHKGVTTCISLNPIGLQEEQSEEEQSEEEQEQSEEEQEQSEEEQEQSEEEQEQSGEEQEQSGEEQEKSEEEQEKSEEEQETSEEEQEVKKIEPIKDITTTKVKEHRRGFYTDEEASELIKIINDYYEKNKCIPVNIGKEIETLKKSN